jgi:hypothetical protein
VEAQFGQGLGPCAPPPPPAREPTAGRGVGWRPPSLVRSLEGAEAATVTTTSQSYRSYLLRGVCVINSQQ